MVTYSVFYLGMKGLFIIIIFFFFFKKSMFGGEVKRKDFALLTESIKSMVIR